MSTGDTSASLDLTTVSVSQADDGKDITVSAGGMLLVRLASNPSTGYGWSFVTSPDSRLRLVGHTYRAGVASPGRVGAGGVEEFQFAFGEGAPPAEGWREWLRMMYIRSWERGIEGAQVWAIRVSS